MEMKIKCWKCGKDAEVSRPYGVSIAKDWMRLEINELSKPSNTKRSYCRDCFEKHKKELKEEKELFVKLKKKIMYENALELLEKQAFDFTENEEAIKVVEEKVSTNPDKFDSSYEIAVAIVLVSNFVYAKMQYKVLEYQVDFLLPDYHVVLEIDGEQHKHNKGRDSVRDERIKKELGKGWQVIRIPTELLDMNASNVVRAIEEVLDYRETNHIDWRNI